jgi:hypothetical protein
MQRRNPEGLFAVHHKILVSHQVLLMQFRPRQDQFRLLLWQVSLFDLASVDVNHSFVFPIVNMKMGRRMFAGSVIHPDDETVEHRYGWHDLVLACLRPTFNVKPGPPPVAAPSLRSGAATGGRAEALVGRLFGPSS